MSKQTNKKWYQSQSKVGSLLIVISAILATIGGWLNGSIDMSNAVIALIAEIGALKLAFGIRDLPIINNKK